MVKRVVSLDGLDDEQLSVVVARAGAIRAAFKAWRIGRGRPVDRAALEASGVVSESFIDRLKDLAVEVEGDPLQLIDALEKGQVKRWRPAITERLREYLEDQGYLDHEQPLAQEELYHHALASSAREHVGVDLGEGWLERMIASLPTE